VSVILTITAAEVGALARLDIIGDSVAADDVGFVLTNEQEAIEQTLDPAAFDAGVTELLRRGVAKLLASEVLFMRQREDGAAGDLQLGSGASEIRLVHAPASADELRISGDFLLTPYRRKTHLVNGPSSSLRSGTSPTLPASDPQNQDTLYGPTELERSSGTGANVDTAGVTLTDPDTGRW
jgi:hypothetical protein